MFFSEIYSAYYNAVAKIISEALDSDITRERITQIVKSIAFDESILAVPGALESNRWQLINTDGSTNIISPPTMPLTNLQKSWLNAIYLDPKIRLFLDDVKLFDDVEPLFTPDDYEIYDKYLNGDNFEDEAYIERFRLILHAINNKYPLHLRILNKVNKTFGMTISPYKLEYSLKDDKFRLIGCSGKYNSMINLSNIVSVEKANENAKYLPYKKRESDEDYVSFELVNERNALDRALIDFSNFRKRAEKIDDNKYRITIYFNKNDINELVIRILSFGPVVKVVEPESFKVKIKNRIKSQFQVLNI